MWLKVRGPSWEDATIQLEVEVELPDFMLDRIMNYALDQVPEFSSVSGFSWSANND